MKNFNELNLRMAQANLLVGFQINVDPSHGGYDLTLELSKDISDPDAVAVLFQNVAELKIDLGLGGWSQIHMLGIRRENPGWERPYVVEEIEYRSLSFICASARLIQN